MAIALKIVTPDHVAFEATVQQVVLPTTEGEMGVLPGHIPLITQVEGGALQVFYEDGRQEKLAVDKGFAEIYGDTVAILTEAAIDVKEIDLASVADAKQRAEAALAEAGEGIDPAELERLEAINRFAVFQELAKRG